jgi:hypothetical protein
MIALTDYARSRIDDLASVTNGDGAWVTVTVSASDNRPSKVPTYLTEAQAWRAIARRIERRGCKDGLCAEIDLLDDADRIPWTIARSMYDRVHAHLIAMAPPPKPRAWWDFRRAEPVEKPLYLDDVGTAGSRILAAYMLAHEAEDEGR